MFTGLSNSHLYTASRIRVEFQVPELDGPKATLGTAFFVRNKHGQMCLITNRHVLDLDYTERSGKYRGASVSRITVETFLAPQLDTNAKPMERHVANLFVAARPIRFATQYAEDVACIVNPVFDSQGAGPARLEYFFDYDLLADDEWIESHLSICDFVVFPGRPQVGSATPSPSKVPPWKIQEHSSNCGLKSGWPSQA